MITIVCYLTHYVTLTIITNLGSELSHYIKNIKQINLILQIVLENTQILNSRQLKLDELLC